MLYDSNLNIIQSINAIPRKEHAGGGGDNEQGVGLADEGASESPDHVRAGEEESMEASSRRTSPAREVS